VNLER